MKSSNSYYGNPYDNLESAGGFGIFCGIVTYLFGIVGLIIMLCTAPFLYVLPGIVLALVLILPIFLRLAHGTSVGVALSACIEYGHYMFTLLVGMWWLLFSTYSAGAGTLIAIGIMSMYAMYYFPCFLALDASARGLPRRRCVGAAFICFVDSLIFFAMMSLVVGERMEDFTNVLFSTAIVVSGNLQHAVNKYREAKKNGRGVHGFVSVVLVVAITFGSVFSALYVLPQTTQKRYEKALAMVENGNYREARVELLDIINYPDAAKLYEKIEFVGLEVGETVTLGRYMKGLDKHGQYQLTWTVLKVENGKALLLCDEIVTCLDSNSLSRWDDGNNVRDRLRGIYASFEDADKELILESAIKCTAGNVHFTAKDHLFLLSQEELEEYCTDEKMIFTKNKGSYYVSQETFGMTLCYYTRSTDENGKWIVADCVNKEFTTRKDESYRQTGLRPAMYISCPDTLAD